MSTRPYRGFNLLRTDAVQPALARPALLGLLLGLCAAQLWTNGQREALTPQRQRLQALQAQLQAVEAELRGAAEQAGRIRALQDQAARLQAWQAERLQLPVWLEALSRSPARLTQLSMDSQALSVQGRASAAQLQTWAGAGMPAGISAGAPELLELAAEPDAAAAGTVRFALRWPLQHTGERR